MAGYLFVDSFIFFFIEGFVHFTLVMEYDVLMSYAVTGCLWLTLYGEEAGASKRAWFSQV
ncbi:hypothetical protein BsIDN1_71160 [Bacillus safensis]|uniref:Uncharacterized protein n=1 Tax=Bacillus safensis TaxID=561879 RepID=A0A5S9MK45_BACIA|nr:hypothetical protein BsIDN1_71160 [Bacillus safensis]